MKTKQFFLIAICCLVGSFRGFPQDSRPVVGVAQFSCEGDEKYSGLVTEKVVEMLTNTKRFLVVDRTSYDKIHQELEFQKTEAFIDSKNLAEQGVAVAAQYMLTGHITKIPVSRMKNPDGSVNGYKASVAFQMKVVNVETGLSNEAASFEGKVSELMLSPETAVTAAMRSLENELNGYFRKEFPVNAKLLKILQSKKDAAVMVLIAGGKNQGIVENDQLEVEYVEMLDGKPYPSVIGLLKVQRLSGLDFSECKVVKGGVELFSRFNAGENINCKLIVK